MHDDSALLLGFAEPRTEESVEEQFPSKLGGTPVLTDFDIY